MIEYVSVREAARMLQVHENTIRRWCDLWLLEYTRLPNSGFRRITIDSIEAMLKGEVPRHGCWDHFDAPRLHDCSACRDAVTLFDVP